jgi:hypothetical protein
LTPDEAYDFMDMKLKKLYPDNGDMAKEFDMKFILDYLEKQIIDYYTKEAKKWKQTVSMLLILRICF